MQAPEKKEYRSETAEQSPLPSIEQTEPQGFRLREWRPAGLVSVGAVSAMALFAVLLFWLSDNPHWVRDKPFSRSVAVGSLEWLFKAQPHPALSAMPVIPAARSGKLVPRPFPDDFDFPRSYTEVAITPDGSSGWALGDTAKAIERLDFKQQMSVPTQWPPIFGGPQSAQTSLPKNTVQPPAYKQAVPHDTMALIAGSNGVRLWEESGSLWARTWNGEWTQELGYVDLFASSPQNAYAVAVTGQEFRASIGGINSWRRLKLDPGLITALPTAKSVQVDDNGRVLIFFDSEVRVLSLASDNAKARESGTSLPWRRVDLPIQTADGRPIVVAQVGSAFYPLDWVPAEQAAAVMRSRFSLDVGSGASQPVQWMSSWRPETGLPVVIQRVGNGPWERLSYTQGFPPLVIAAPLMVFALFLVWAGLRARFLQSQLRKDAAVEDEGTRGLDEKDRIAASAIAEVGSSDSPLDESDPDALGLSQLAHQIARFIRNAKTRPPLTFGILGEWGTGKSSLMNLLKTDLQSGNCYPVWFNAWHHQKEEHLLAALLENIKSQAIPPWWLLSGIAFRIRLLQNRWQAEIKTFVAVLIFVVIGLMLYSMKVGVEAKTGFAAFQVFMESLVIGVPISGALVLMHGLRAIRFDPGKLIKSVGKLTQVRKFGSQLGFRHRFEQEFRDVCAALRTDANAGLVIMIDDLDRCRPESVLEVLEAVNFLSSAGECFIFLGMARNQVERCVAAGFKETMILVPAGEGDDLSERQARELMKFANQYLDKLINIPINVPTPDEDQVRALMATEAGRPQQTRLSDTQKQARRQARRWSGGIRLGADFLGAVLVFSVLVYAFAPYAPQVVAVADHALSKVGQDDKASATTETQTSETPTANTEQSREANSARSADGVSLSLKSSLQLSMRAPDTKALSGGMNWWPMLALLLVPVFWAWGQKRFSGIAFFADEKVEDSPEFVQALAYANRLIHENTYSIRAKKQFLNHLRFVAARLRPGEEEPGWLERRLRVRFGDDSELLDEPVNHGISDTKLVFLAVAELIDRALLQPDSSGELPDFHGVQTRIMAGPNSDKPVDGTGRSESYEQLAQLLNDLQGLAYPVDWHDGWSSDLALYLSTSSA